jgi:hypothetical protein
MQNVPSVIVYRSPVEAWLWESGAWLWVYPVALAAFLICAGLMFRGHRKAVERMRRPAPQPKWRFRP